MGYPKEEWLPSLIRISPSEFEQLVGALWERQGWNTTVTRESRDRGIDIIAESRVRRQFIQVKQYGGGNKIGRPAIQQYSGLYRQYDVDEVVVVTTSAFTTEAVQTAHEVGVDLIDGDALVELISEAGGSHFLERNGVPSASTSRTGPGRASKPVPPYYHCDACDGGSPNTECVWIDEEDDRLLFEDDPEIVNEVGTKLDRDEPLFSICQNCKGKVTELGRETEIIRSILEGRRDS